MALYVYKVSGGIIYLIKGIHNVQSLKYYSRYRGPDRLLDCKKIKFLEENWALI